MSMQTISTKHFFDREFWMIGLGMCLIAIALATAKIYSAVRENAEAQAGADLKMRATYPELKLLFGEWDKCNQGIGDYANNRYISRDQCDLAILELAKKEGAERSLIEALHFRDSQ